MNFFEYQENARRNTRYLILLFVLAVASLVGLTYLLFILVGQASTGSGNMTGVHPIRFDLDVFLIIAGVVVTLVVLGSLGRISSLSKGGASVAEMMDGELLTDSGGDYKRRRLLNVVEEMAIASGIVVPPVYLLHESGINAFAAGYSVNDAVIGITQGAIDHLSRDELQGVIAHEFSHIFNGDMKLNIRLVGILYGILMMTIIGRIVLSGSRGSSRSKNGGAIVFIGLGLIVIGYAGNFFGKLIKAAVSRQREFLADASAVQYTRNPQGISGALKRIGGYEPAASIENPKVEEIGHALFASSFQQTWFSMTATHPPLEERIKRIDPGWKGEFQYSDHQDVDSDEKIKGFSSGSTSNLGEASDQVGELRPENIANAQYLIAGLPAAFYQAAHEPFGARAVIYYLLLDKNEEIRKIQLLQLQQFADAAVFRELAGLIKENPELSRESRLPLMEMSVSALRQLSDQQFEAFRINMDRLITADKSISLFEWALRRIVLTSLEDARRQKKQKAMYGNFSRLVDHCSLVISLLIYCDGKPEEIHEGLIKVAAEKLNCPKLQLYEKSNLDIKQLDHAIDELKRLKPLLKPKFLKACAAVIEADRKVSSTEAELMRAISETLDCPMPPITVGDVS